MGALSYIAFYDITKRVSVAGRAVWRPFFFFFFFFFDDKPPAFESDIV